MHRHGLRIVALGVAIGSLGLVVPSTHSSAIAASRITGRVHNLRGWTVVALAIGSGRTSQETIRYSGDVMFSLAQPGPTWTLHFITPKGRYGGEVVAATPFTMARYTVFHTGFSGPLNLGAVTMHSTYGFATTSTTRGLVANRWAFSAGKGATLRPAGNGKNLGLTSLTALLAAVAKRGHPCPSSRGLGGDPDCSGVAALFNIAPSGNKVLAALQPQSTSRVNSHTVSTPSTVSPWMSQLFLYVDHAVNADVHGVTTASIDQTLESSLNIKLLGLPSVSSITPALRVDLNCYGLSFCSDGGSGQAVLENGQAGLGGTFSTTPFPGTALNMSNLFGEIIGPSAPAGLLGTTTGGLQEFSLNPVAPSSEVGSGDVITVTSSTDGGSTWQQTPTTIQFVFVTVPAITTVSDSTGYSNSVTYGSLNPLGSAAQPLILHPDPSTGHVIATFHFFRPQRAGVAGAGEPPWMDIGHLWYVLNLGGVGSCSLGSYVTSSLSPTLSLVDPQTLQGSGASAPPPGAGMLVDSSSDHAATNAPSNELSFSIDMTRCFLDAGKTLPVGTPFPATDLEAASPNSPDHANEQFWMEVLP